MLFQVMPGKVRIWHLRSGCHVRSGCVRCQDNSG